MKIGLKATNIYLSPWFSIFCIYLKYESRMQVHIFSIIYMNYVRNFKSYKLHKVNCIIDRYSWGDSFHGTLIQWSLQ